jgi:hypothetical protein
MIIANFANPPVKNKCPKLAVSANKRFLTGGGKPFFWLGDTGWLLLSKLNHKETEKYLEKRKRVQYYSGNDFAQCFCG